MINPIKLLLMKENICMYEEEKMESKKLTPLRIIEFLEENTDEDHALLPSEIIEDINKKYKEEPIKKTSTLIEYIDDINRFFSSKYDNTDIIQFKYDENGRYKTNKRYYYGQRSFEFAEILFLQNILFNSNALHQKEITEICKKLTSFLSKYQRSIVKEKMLTDGSSKTTNRNVYINIETIQNSIVNKENIEFDYCEFNLDKKLVLRKRPYRYIVSPYALIYSYGSYFLIGYHLPTDKVRTYRVDKIKDIRVNSEELYHINKDFNVSGYIKNSAFMHADENKIEVRLRCKMSILDNVIERFENCKLFEDKNNPDYFTAIIPNTTYIGIKYWILEFTSACEVIEPGDLRQDVVDTLAKALKQYEDK